jgi:mannose-6-phosphate isomerase-like protein (cupin superfamily)
MPFFAPNHAIIEAIEYDGTPEGAAKVIKWIEPQITTRSDQIKFVDGRLLVVYYPTSAGWGAEWEKIREVKKGDCVYINTGIGSVRILYKEDIKQNYELIPS